MKAPLITRKRRLEGSANLKSICLRGLKRGVAKDVIVEMVVLQVLKSG